MGREIVCNEGIRILLKSLDKGGAQQDTVAAVTHILFTVTNPTTQSIAVVESQLWIHSTGDTATDASGSSGQVRSKFAAKHSKTDSHSKELMPLINSSSVQNNTSLAVIVHMLSLYFDRKDVVRAACRLLNNVCEYAGVVVALEKLHILDRLLECVGR